MKIILTYDNEKREVKIEGPNLISLPPLFNNYVEDIKATYEEHMLRLREDGMIPKGKLEIELTFKQEE